MTLKSLDKLCSEGFANNLYRNFNSLYGENLLLKIADEIQRDVDEYYLPRPLFEDGDPVQFLDYVKDVVLSYPVMSITLYADGSFDIGNDSSDFGYYSSDDRLKRPEHYDTQERIDNDATLPAAMYCQKHDIELSCDFDYEEVETKKVLDLLRRQRELLGGEA